MKTQESGDRGLKLCRLSTEVFVFLILFLYPLFAGFWGYTRLTDSKFIFFAAAACGWLLCVFVGQFIGEAPGLRVRPAAVSVLIAVFLLLCGVSALFSPYRESVLWGAGRYDGLITTALCCCIFFGVSRYGAPKKRFLYALTLSAAINCAVAVIQLWGVNVLGLFPSDYTYYDGGIKYSGEFLGLIGNADLFSAVLCLALPISLSLYITSKKRPVFQLPCMALMGFILIVCGVSGGRLALAAVLLLGAPFLLTDGEKLRRALEAGAVLSAAVAIAAAFYGRLENGVVSVSFKTSTAFFIALTLSGALLLLRLFFRGRTFKRKTMRRFFILLNSGIVLAALVLIFLVDPGSGTLSELHSILRGHIEDGFGSSRVLIWKDTLGLIGERPLLGGGPGTIASRLDIHFARFVAETGKTLETSVDNAHNVYLGIAADDGLPALLVYVSAQVLTVSGVLKKRCASPAFLCILCGLVCYWISDLFNLGLFIVSPMMWVLWGIVCSGRGGKAPGLDTNKPATE